MRTDDAERNWRKRRGEPGETRFWRVLGAVARFGLYIVAGTVAIRIMDAYGMPMSARMIVAVILLWCGWFARGRYGDG